MSYTKMFGSVKFRICICNSNEITYQCCDRNSNIMTGKNKQWAVQQIQQSNGPHEPWEAHSMYHLTSYKRTCNILPF